MSGSRDAKAEGQQRDNQVITVGLGGPYPPELINPVHAATSTQTLVRLVPEHELHDPDGEKRYRRRIASLRREERRWTLKLLECTPFRGLTDHQVRDVRSTDPKHKKRIPKRRQVKPCPERRVLLSSLAVALTFWKSAPASAAWRYFGADRDQGLAIHQQWITVLAEHRRRRIPFNDQTIDPRSLLKAIQYVNHEISKIQPTDVEAVQISRNPPTDVYTIRQAMPGAPLHDAGSVIIATVQMMFEDFRAFGHNTEVNARRQTILQEEFPRDAIYHALAAILNGVGVHNTHGKCFTAAGIQRLLARHPPPPWMYPRDDRILGLDN